MLRSFATLFLEICGQYGSWVEPIKKLERANQGRIVFWKLCCLHSNNIVKLKNVLQKMSCSMNTIHFYAILLVNYENLTLY